MEIGLCEDPITKGEVLIRLAWTSCLDETQGYPRFLKRFHSCNNAMITFETKMILMWCLTMQAYTFRRRSYLIS